MISPFTELNSSLLIKGYFKQNKNSLINYKHLLHLFCLLSNEIDYNYNYAPYTLIQRTQNRYI